MPLISYIPKRFENGFRELSEIEEEGFSSLKEALNKAPLSKSIDTLVDNLMEIKKLDHNSTSNILNSVGGLVPFLEEEENMEESAEDISQLALSSELLSAKDAAKFKERLLYLLREKKIYYASKAEDLLTESENIFLSGKIVSDVRPIFELNVELVPKIGIIMHTFHIHYQSDSAGPHQDIYFSLDSYDIQALTELLLRAEKKEESLKVFMKNSGMINLSD